MTVQNQPSSLSLQAQFLSRNLSARSYQCLKQADEKITEAHKALNEGQHILAVNPLLEQAREALGKIQTTTDKLVSPWKRLTECFAPQVKDTESVSSDAASSSNVSTSRLGTSLKRLDTQAEAKALFDNTVVSALATEWKQKHAQYDPTNNGKWPLRDVHDQAIPCKLAKAQPASRLLLNMEAVKSFLKPDLSPAERAKLYSRNMECRKITAEDIQARPAEKQMIGQNGVFAARNLSKGTVLGVYGGKLIKPFGSRDLIDDTYLYDCKSLGFIDGDNIISRINTTLKYDATGKPVGFRDSSQTQDAPYNVASYPVALANQHGQVFKIPVFVAKRDIPAGAELRLNYHYAEPDEALAKLFSEPKNS